MRIVFLKVSAETRVALRYAGHVIVKASSLETRSAEASGGSASYTPFHLNLDRSGLYTSRSKPIQSRACHVIFRSRPGFACNAAHCSHRCLWSPLADSRCGRLWEDLCLRMGRLSVVSGGKTLINTLPYIT
ncbi:hypothetical protein HPB47_003870 [Ixodes persulcatus]|uniref:Uncharacterized protein n=1 Tax=Ixodes persulcatus TaxID=34615 RepID=A0AC60PHC1_IXOPE|nr:hypothetical protein HPB47_003870 [Ixodes persulcatus]